ncbi:MAG: AmmeMemoRadiSam system protein B [Bacteroidales bacterium]
MIRKAAYAGRFYPDSGEAIFQLLEEIEELGKYRPPAKVSGSVIGAVLPHAGHIYSGYQTLPFFKYLSVNRIVPDTFIILNPNHSGRGPGIALDPHEFWSNPVGKVPLDMELAEALPYPNDADAQRNEHSAEVIIPFIQYYYNGQIKILPVCMNDQTSSSATKLAADLHHAVELTGRNAVVIASSDFSHFLTPEEGRRQDQLILEKIRNKDVKAVERTVVKNGISVCGYGPIMTLMAYAGMIDKNYRPTMLARGHSGEIAPSRDVVDYISILFHTSN